MLYMLCLNQENTAIARFLHTLNDRWVLEFDIYVFVDCFVISDVILRDVSCDVHKVSLSLQTALVLLSHFQCLSAKLEAARTHAALKPKMQMGI